MLSDDQTMLGTLGWVYGMSGKRELAQELLNKVKGLSSTQYVDPALGDWKLDLTNVVTENEETIKVATDSSDRIKVTIPMSAGEVAVPAFYISDSTWYKGKNSDKTFVDDENTDVFVDGDEYFVVSNANNKESYLMQIAKVDYSDNQITFKDVMTGDKYMVTYTDSGGAIDGTSDGTFTVGSLTIDIDVNDTEEATGFVLRVDMNDDADWTDYKVPFYTKGGATVRIFDTATVDTNILTFTRDKNRQQTKACIVKEKLLINLSDYFRQNLVKANFSSSDSWVILSNIEQRIKAKI